MSSANLTPDHSMVSWHVPAQSVTGYFLAGISPAHKEEIIVQYWHALYALPTLGNLYKAEAAGDYSACRALCHPRSPPRRWISRHVQPKPCGESDFPTDFSAVAQQHRSTDVIRGASTSWSVNPPSAGATSAASRPWESTATPPRAHQRSVVSDDPSPAPHAAVDARPGQPPVRSSKLCSIAKR
jgi:hypothetical protein